MECIPEPAKGGFTSRGGRATVGCMRAAASFDLVGSQPGDLREVVDKCVQDLGGRVGGGLVFVCGAMARQVHEVANVLRAMALPGPVLVAGGAGVMTERGPYEQTSACAGLLWQAGHCVPFTLDKDGEEPMAQRLAGATRSAASRGGPVAVFAAREAVSPTDLFDTQRPLDLPLFGGGTLGRPGAMVVADGRVKTADVVGFALHGVGRAVVRASPACQLLGQPQPITAADGALLLTVGAQPALELLRSQASNVAGQRPVVLAVDLRDDPRASPRLMLRGIRGIHESRKGVMISEEIRVGTRVAFAVLDGPAAAADLHTTLREMSRDVRGGMPRFGIYVDCAGRGTQLYGESGVDVQVLRSRFPGLPIAGVTSAFEIGPGTNGAAVHLYSGVFCLVYAPS